MYLKFVFLSVDNDSGDLLIEEDKDGGEDSGNYTGNVQPPGHVTGERIDKPSSTGAGGLW